MTLELQIKAWLSVCVGLEDLGMPPRLGDGTIPVSGLLLLGLVELDQVVRDGAAQVPVDRDQPVAPLRERAFVHPWFEVETIEVGVRAELEQVRPTGLVLTQQDQVEPAVLLPGVGAVGPVRGATVQIGRDIGLDPENGLEVGLLGGLVELGRGVQVAVVRDRNRIHPQLLAPADQPVRPVGSVQQGVMRVQVQVDKATVERGVGHRPSVAPRIQTGTYCAWLVDALSGSGVRALHPRGRSHAFARSPLKMHRNTEILGRCLPRPLGSRRWRPVGPSTIPRCRPLVRMPEHLSSFSACRRGV